MLNAKGLTDRATSSPASLWLRHLGLCTHG